MEEECQRPGWLALLGEDLPLAVDDAWLMLCIFSSQTVFAKGGGHSLDIQSTLGYETIGLDWTVDPVEARKIVGENITLQGNLDPQDLYKSPVSTI